MSTTKTPATQAPATPKTNGIDVDALRGAIAACTEDAANARTSWKVLSTWRGGTRTDHQVDGVRIGRERIERRFTLRIDEPHALCGTDEHANPQEHLMAAINACMMVGYSAVAALMGIELRSLEVELSGDIDLRGFLGIDPSVANGYEQLRQTVRIASDASPEELRELHEAVKATSPNFFNITRAVPMDSELVLVER